MVGILAIGIHVFSLLVFVNRCKIKVILSFVLGEIVRNSAIAYDCPIEKEEKQPHPKLLSFGRETWGEAVERGDTVRERRDGEKSGGGRLKGEKAGEDGGA